MAQDLQLHTRKNRSLLANAEKRALFRPARPMPAGINSDHLTLLGLSAILVAGLGYRAASRNKWALLAFLAALALNRFGDSLDGTLARVRKRQRPRYGFYVNHIVDIGGTTFLLCGLALSGFMNPLIALGVLAAFVLVEAEVFLSTHVRQALRLSFMGFGPTELRILLALGTLVLFDKPRVFLGAAGPYRLYVVGGIIAIAALASVPALSTVRNTHALYKAKRVDRGALRRAHDLLSSNRQEPAVGPTPLGGLLFGRRPGLAGAARLAVCAHRGPGPPLPGRHHHCGRGRRCAQLCPARALELGRSQALRPPACLEGSRVSTWPTE